MKAFLTAILACTAILGCSCSKATHKRPSPPTVDLATPESTLESYWKISDWESEFGIYLRQVMNKDQEEIEQTESKVYGKGLTDIIRSNKELMKKSSRPEYERRIVEMKKETDTRVVAIVQIKNVSPIPEGADRNENIMKWREDGAKYKFVLEQSKGSWQVAEIYKLGYKEEWTPFLTKMRPQVPWVAEL